jgi:hypothetical protein
MVWGIFPDFFPEKNISFESHFWGLVAGAVLAWYFRKIGPQRTIYEWEDEDEGGESPNEEPEMTEPTADQKE